MKLTEDQKVRLAEHISKKPIKYIELYNELYDHYASAYESGDDCLESTIKTLDEHFCDEEVKAINKKLYKKIRSSVNSIYWKELKNFWSWPKIIITFLFLTLGFALIELFPVKSIIWYIIVPVIILNATLSIYGIYFSREKQYGLKEFQSAHLNASGLYFLIPLQILQIFMIQPSFVNKPENWGLHFLERYPIIIFCLIILFTTSALVGWKLFNCKIRIQYL